VNITEKHLAQRLLKVQGIKSIKSFVSVDQNARELVNIPSLVENLALLAVRCLVLPISQHAQFSESTLEYNSSALRRWLADAHQRVKQNCRVDEHEFASKRELIQLVTEKSKLPTELCRQALRKNDWDPEFALLWLEDNLFEVELDMANLEKKARDNPDFNSGCYKRTRRKQRYLRGLLNLSLLGVKKQLNQLMGTCGQLCNGLRMSQLDFLLMTKR